MELFKTVSGKGASSCLVDREQGLQKGKYRGISMSVLFPVPTVWELCSVDIGEEMGLVF